MQQPPPQFERRTSSASTSSVRARRRTISSSPRMLSLAAKPVAVFCWGWGGNGQLGTNDRESRIKPQIVYALLEKTSIAQLACGSRFTIALSTTGSVFAWGKNDYGQLGVGHHLETQLEPRLVDALSDIGITRIATRGSHVLAVSEDGAVYSWGRGDEGQLGHDTRESLHFPKRIPDLHQIVAVACGRAHSVALSYHGAVYTWGSGEDGALGMLDLDAALSPIPLPISTSFVAITCGSRHTLALSRDGRVFSWGWNLYGQLGLGHLDTVRFPTEIPTFIGLKVSQIVSGFRHNFAVLPQSATNSDVYGWGWNEHGQLGDVDSADSVVLRPQRIKSLTDVAVTSLAAGGRHSVCSIHPHGSFAWGRGTDGELGTGSVNSKQTATCILHQRTVFQVACGWAHSAALVQEEAAPPSAAISFKWVTSGDVDAFSGMLVQSLLQLMIISTLLPTHCAVAATAVLPAAAATTVLGNLFFLFQGVSLGQKERRHDVTGIPHGINTVLVFAYTLSIMQPEYQLTGSAEKAHEVGIFAAIATGALQMLLLPLMPLLQASVPKAALLSSVSGIALTFLSMGFAFEIWENPLIALGPLLLFLVSYGAGVKLPMHVPTGLGALLLGTTLALVLYYTGTPTNFVPFSTPYVFELQFLSVDPSLVFRALTSGAGFKYLSIIIPMVLVNVMSAIANLETAAAVGDKYDPMLCVLGDSIVTILGACLGNPFPTGIYIGQPIYKAMGARVGYLGLNAVAVLLLSALNAVPWIIGTIPIASGVGFLLWIGMVITSSSFERRAHDSNHGVAVVLGMVPALAAWAFQLLQTGLAAVHPSSNMTATLDLLAAAGMHPQGMVALSQGYLLTAIVLASTMVHILERDFIYAAAWMVLAAILSGTGVIHAFVIEGDAIQPAFGWFPTAWSVQFCVVYLGMAAMLTTFHLGEEEYKYTAAHAMKRLKACFHAAKKKVPPTHLPTTAAATGAAGGETQHLLRTQSTVAEME
ncbi:Aste57867_12493 [Aphanomyces stellatus]|uniref:Aste57867_12493 protein n=1 Tax=Aphanomyces stellatus TaxID=120398 RepID=A0A485KVQ0_9STRA|nr:hypothetical protein As57867_012447 [Aphanomyces stellatus]VFT89344.1 Aste57867_12493 [Aphanomyces stellatus]